MTDFTNARNVKCPLCGMLFCDVEGPLCDCAKCEICGEWFEDGVKDGFCETCREQLNDAAPELLEACETVKRALTHHDLWKPTMVQYLIAELDKAISLARKGE